MASSLMSRAAKEIERKNAQLRRIRQQDKETEKNLFASAATLAGAAAAGWIDRPEGAPEEVFGVPTNAAVGIIMVGVPLVWSGMPAKDLFAGFGLGMLSGVLYDYVKTSEMG